MIYIFLGNDFSKKNLILKKITKDCDIFRFKNDPDLSNRLLGYASSDGLFGDKRAFIIEDYLGDGDSLSGDDLSILEKSNHTFIFLEDKLNVQDEKKYKKYADIQKFETQKIVKKEDNFAIANAFANKDKIKTWVLYREAVSNGVEPEAISGMLFWKIKNMMINGNRLFSKEELKKQSSSLVSLYHKSHLGEIDFIIGLEQFILSSLSK